MIKQIIKLIYDIIPGKKFLYTTLKFFWIPPQSIYQHLHFKDTIRIPVNINCSFQIKHYGYKIENEIFWAGITNSFEKESLKLWIKLCEDAKVILDIGSNTGVYSLVAKAVNPTSKVFAFEPIDRVFDKLQKNISLNNYDITPIKKAISNFDGNATIYDTYTEHQTSVTVNKNLNNSSIPVIETHIETLTLNSFIDQFKLTNIDLMKIDVETHEPEVLEGFSNYLSKYKPTMLIEILNSDVADKINNTVSNLGYLYFNIDEKGSIRQTRKIEKSDYFNYLLCSHKIANDLGLLTLHPPNIPNLKN